VEISLREGVHPQFLRSVEIGDDPAYTQKQVDYHYERIATMHKNLPIYRKVTALTLLVLLFFYVLFYGQDAQQV